MFVGVRVCFCGVCLCVGVWFMSFCVVYVCGFVLCVVCMCVFDCSVWCVCVCV